MNLARARRLEVRLAFAFLTRLPCGPEPGEQVAIGNAAWAFPLAGIAVGIFSGSVYLAATLAFPALPSAILAMIAAILATGALHEDGLADVADGFGGGTSRDDKLRIMRDSQVGSFGVVALIAAFGLTAVSMATAPADLRTLAWFAAVGACSRAAMVVPMALLRPARADGLGHAAVLTLGWRFWIAIAFAACAALATVPELILATALIAVSMLLLAKRQVDGQTGDVLGATQKVAECACWLALAIQVNGS